MRYALCLLLLSGCTSMGQLADRGAQLSDEARETALWTLCRGISIGAWVRDFGSSPERAAAWRVLCSAKIDATP